MRIILSLSKESPASEFSIYFFQPAYEIHIYCECKRARSRLYYPSRITQRRKDVWSTRPRSNSLPVPLAHAWCNDVTNEWTRHKCETCSADDPLYEDEQPRSRSVVLRTKFRHRTRDLPYTGSSCGISIGKHWGFVIASGISWPSTVQHRVWCDSARSSDRQNQISVVGYLITSEGIARYNSRRFEWRSQERHVLDWVEPSIMPMSCVMICPYCIDIRFHSLSLTSMFWNIV